MLLTICSEVLIIIFWYRNLVVLMTFQKRLIIALQQDAVMRHPTTIQAARAANVIYCMLQYRRLLDREELEPVSMQLCGFVIELLKNRKSKNVFRFPHPWQRQYNAIFSAQDIVGLMKY